MSDQIKVKKIAKTKTETKTETKPKVTKVTKAKSEIKLIPEPIKIEQVKQKAVTKTGLSRNGYRINKKLVSNEILEEYKKELTVKPICMDDSDVDPYPVFRETPSELIVPRYYGINKLGNPVVNTIKHQEIDIQFNGKLHDYQIDIVNKMVQYIKKNGGGIVSVPCGRGKCLAKGTKVMMHDGSIKLVEDIRVGDQLMGDDSKPRKVLSLAHGFEEMYDIIPTKGDKYTVNKSHILSLKYGTIAPVRIKGIKYNKGDIIDISIDDYLNLPKSYHGKGSPLRGFRVPIEFDKKDIPIDAYILGCWLGDGNSRKVTITNVDQSILNYIEEYAKSLNLNFKQNKWDNISYDITRKSGKDINKIYDEFKKMNLFLNKHIPDLYKCNSKDIRLQILAGILDTDGYLTDCKAGYDICLKSEKLIDDIIYISRSLGFSCYKSKCTKTCTNAPGGPKKGTYFRTGIYGKDIDKIPVKLIAKAANERRQIKDPLVYGITVKSVGMGEYYGFEIDGNRRFVLGDFTVTHNTVMALKTVCELKVKALIIVHKTFLQDQWVDRAKQFTNARLGIIRQNKIQVKDRDIVIGMMQSISMKEYDPEIFNDFGIVIFDEVHHTPGRIFSNSLRVAGATYTLGLSATPNRLDGLTRVIHWHLGDFIYQEKSKKNKQVVAKIFHYKSNDKLFREKTKWPKFKPDTVKMITNFCNLEQRTTHIINIINELRKYPERKMLILSGRKTHLVKLKELVDQSINADIASEKIEPDECKTYMYTGDCTKQERGEAEANGDILFGTFQLAEEGLDIARLNTIILATPKKDVVQAVGRIMRKILTKGDVRPLIIDIFDEVSVFPNQGKHRLSCYEKGKYKTEHYYIKNDKIITFDTYMQQELNYTQQEIEQLDDRTVYDPNLSSILDMQRVENLCDDVEINSESDKSLEDSIELAKPVKTNKKQVNSLYAF